MSVFCKDCKHKVERIRQAAGCAKVFAERNWVYGHHKLKSCYEVNTDGECKMFKQRELKY